MTGERGASAIRDRQDRRSRRDRRDRRGHGAARILRMEGRVYTSIARAVARRPDVERGGVGIGYHRPLMTVLMIFIILSAVEIPVIDLIVHPWPAVRIPLLILGIWGLTWMIGLLCAMLVRPHAVGPCGVRVRNGLEIDVPVPWDDIASVAIARRVVHPDAAGTKPPRISAREGDRAGLVYAERIQDETNIEIELERPVGITLPGRGPQEVTLVWLWADDPRAFLDACRPHLV
ncbi:hypothetical protein G3H63_12275 [Microbacterium resistens]|uniref:hypothetical protein n=1 Tax=Microbacterium resistens TaxID=156977 RepID=UPI001C5A2D9D|nr:hypothetical protein [Microbacterium resistens]MBW1639840.1 hypothetical protein [Microbacterium resistens]